MKTLILLITIIAATSLVRAGENDEIPALSEAEVIWESEQIGGLNEVEISPLGEHFYNTKDSIVQVRSVETGELIEEILFPNTARLDAISISADGRLMAVSGEPKYIFIYDLVEKREVNRLTTTLLEREENGKIKKYLTEEWHNSSISPDGTKVAGIAEGNQPTGTTSWVVFDIVTGEEIVKETKIRYDNLNPDKSGAGRWISSEFTPDGNYIVSQSTWSQNGEFGPDSIYIHDANTFEVYDVVLNKYLESRLPITLNHYKSLFLFYGFNSDGGYYTYDLVTKLVDKIDLQLTAFALTFLRNSNKVIYGFGFDNHIYNLETKSILYKYQNPKVPKTTSLNDSRVLSTLNQRIYCLKTFLNETRIDNDYEEEIVISPNPTAGSIDIDLSNEHPAEFSYQLISLAGQIIKSNTLGLISKNSQSSIDISDVPNGHYTLRIFSEREEFIFNIIKEG